MKNLKVRVLDGQPDEIELEENVKGKDVKFVCADKYKFYIFYKKQ